MTAIDGNTEANVGVCVVRVDDERFCLSTLDVREVLGARKPQFVPLAPAFMGGLLSYRGDVLTTISLRAVLGLPPTEAASCVVVLKDHESAECFGLIVDVVEEVMRIPEASFEPNPGLLNERRRTILAGVYKTDAGVMARLDPTQLQPSRCFALGEGMEGKTICGL